MARRMISGTEEHPAPGDVFSALLDLLIQQNDIGAWAHFEVHTETKWYKRIFAAEAPFVEVALLNEEKFELNLGYPPKLTSLCDHLQTKGMEVSQNWRLLDAPGYEVPVSDRGILADWISYFFIKVHDCPSDYHVAGWIDGP